MTELNKEIVACRNLVGYGVAAVLGEGEAGAGNIVKSALVDKGTGASAAVSRILYNNLFAEEEREELSPTADILIILIGLYGGVACKEYYGCANLRGNGNTVTAYVADSIAVRVGATVFANGLIVGIGLGIICTGLLVDGTKVLVNVKPS